ncbi:MAG: hypothetical protein QXD51_02770 [Candidatus Anstonellales archaeon]
MGRRVVGFSILVSMVVLAGKSKSQQQNYDYMRDFQRRNDSLFLEEYRKTQDSAIANWNYWWSYTDPTKTGTGTTQSPWAAFIDPVTGHRIYAPGGAVRPKPVWDPDKGIVVFVPETLKTVQGSVPDTTNK